MKVPFIDLLRYESNFLQQVSTQTHHLLEKGFFVGGPVVGEFEQAIKNYTKAPYALGCANGTDAIQVALRSAGINKNDKVIIPDMTFWATFEAVVNVGAIPYTVDVCKDTLHLTLSQVQEAVEKFNPKALILVHLYGWAAPQTTEIRNFCQNQNIILIEDCAQAIGVEIENKSLMGEASISTTSFYPAKVLGASGDAGGVFFKNQNVYEDAKKLINHGRISHYEHGLIGWNSRLGAYEANFLLASLNHLDKRLDSRRKTCARYRNEIKNNKLKFITPAKNVKENGYLSVATMTPETRPNFTKYLQEKEIGFGTVYPGAMSEQPGAKDFLGGKISHGNADWIAKSVINLPCFAYMTDDEVSYVIETVNKYEG